MFSSTVTGGHMVRDGKGNLVFDEDRIKAQKEIIEKLLAGIKPPKGRKPKMFFLGGGPASGKGGFTKYDKKTGEPGELAKEYGIPPVREIDDVTGEEKAMPKGLTPGAVVIDPDTIKILLPEVKEMHARQMIRRVEKSLGLRAIFRTGEEDGKWAENSHEESSMLAKMLQQAALQRGLDIVYDGTGDGKRKSIEKKLVEAKKKDYDTVGLYMTTDLPVAIGSAKLRKDRTGRHVPGTTQNDIYFTLSNLLNPDNPDGNVASLFDSWNLIYRQPKEVDKATGDVIKPDAYIDVAHTDENGELKYDQPALWSSFMGLSKLSKDDIKDVVAKGEEFYREKKAERQREERIRLREAGKNKIEASDLEDSDPRVLEIRNAIATLAAQTGLTTQAIAQNRELLSMILNNVPISEINARANEIRNGRNSNQPADATKKKVEVPPIKPEEPLDPNRDPEAIAAARRIRKKAEELEPEVTATILNLVQAFDGELDKLENRLKSTDSLARKIRKDAEEEYEGNIEKAASELSDAIRYTMVLDTSKYTDTVDSVIKDFESKGYELRIKNFWEDGDDYQGINMKMTKNGITVELQLHTPESLETKVKKLNAIYKSYREIKTNSGKDLIKLGDKMLLWEQMIAIANEIPHPDRYDDLLKIGTLVRKEFEF
jgi:hypothetical protein